MEIDKVPQEALQSLMIDTLEKSGSTAQGYVDLLDRATRTHSSTNEAQVDGFRAYLEQQVAANHAFVDKLLRTRDFKEALRIQFEYFQAQLKAAADHAKVPDSFKRLVRERH